MNDIRIAGVEIAGVEIADVELTASQVQQTLFVLFGFIAFVLIVLIINLITKSRNSSVGKKSAKKEPQYEEIFEVENELFESNPYKNDPDSFLEHPALRTVSLTLIVGLREHLANSTKMAEKPSDQHKAMLAVAKFLEAIDLEGKGVAPIAFTQWNQSAIQGIAARIILNGKSRTALFGPSVAMAKATAKFPSEISAQVESAHAAGQSVFVLAIDGLAYGVFSVSHRLVLIGSGDRI
jgi:hypothetical protein